MYAVDATIESAIFTTFKTAVKATFFSTFFAAISNANYAAELYSFGPTDKVAFLTTDSASYESTYVTTI